MKQLSYHLNTSKTWVIIAAFCCAFQPALWAQEESSRDRENTPENRSFGSHLWYGGGVLLGFNSYLGANVFSFGLSPMVGYKIGKVLSAGPRMEIIYTSYKEVGLRAANLFDIDLGGFVRARVFRGLYFQGELSQEWYDDIYTDTKKQRFNQRLGAGWNWSSGQAGSEIGVFYNFAIAQELDAYQPPLSYRFGFTWNF